MQLGRHREKSLISLSKLWIIVRVPLGFARAASAALNIDFSWVNKWKESGKHISCFKQLSATPWHNLKSKPDCYSTFSSYKNTLSFCDSLHGRKLPWIILPCACKINLVFLNFNLAWINNFEFLAYRRIEDIRQALDAKEVDGIMLDHYYQKSDKLKSLIIVKKFDLLREVGLLFSKDREFIAGCLSIHRSYIWKLVQTITATFQVLNIIHCYS